MHKHEIFRVSKSGIAIGRFWVCIDRYLTVEYLDPYMVVVVAQHGTERLHNKCSIMKLEINGRGTADMAL